MAENQIIRNRVLECCIRSSYPPADANDAPRGRGRPRNRVRYVDGRPQPNFVLARNYFLNQYGEPCPSEQHFGRIWRRYRVNGDLADHRRDARGRRGRVRDRIWEVVLNAIAENGRRSMRAFARQINVNREVVHRIARSVHRPYKNIKQPKLRPQDPPRVFNKQNSRYWVPENPLWVKEVEHQHRWSVHVWGGILGDRLVGPYFLNGNLNGDMYLDLLQNELPGMLEDNPVAALNMWWQQDGASPHNNRFVTECLNQMFGRRWIGYRARGHRQYLTPLDFYLWGRLQHLVYQEEPTTRENMIERIRAAWQQITPEELVRVRGHLVRVMQCCVEHEGHHIQPHMKY
uniref:Transposable element Tc3 transposase n=1 Tax=Trichogramma kaykai TaxID=54128 RepID=A0ABD2WH73_9HYME